MAMPISGPPVEAAGGELGGPGDDGAVAAEERGGAEDDAEAERQAGGQAARPPTRFCTMSRTAVMRDEDGERAAALDEVGDAGVEADAGEEDQQQEVAGVGVEADLDDLELVEREEEDGDEEAAGDRVGDVEAAQQARRGC